MKSRSSCDGPWPATTSSRPCGRSTQID
jgi:hypothetical protein